MAAKSHCMKTHTGCNRRLRLTRNGKLVCRQGGVRHLMTHRSGKKKRQLRANRVIENGGYERKVRRALGKDA